MGPRLTKGQLKCRGCLLDN